MSDNDGTSSEPSVGEGNARLDSRIMGIWDSRSPDPRNPRRARELNGWDDDDDYGDGTDNSGLAYNKDEYDNPIDDDGDGSANDRLDTHYNSGGTLVDLSDGQDEEYAAPEIDNPDSSDITSYIDESNDLMDSDQFPEGTDMPDSVADDRFYEPAGRPEGVDEPDEANPHDDSLPKAVRITIAVSDPAQTLEPVVLSTVVWLSTAR